MRDVCTFVASRVVWVCMKEHVNHTSWSRDDEGNIEEKKKIEGSEKQKGTGTRASHVVPQRSTSLARRRVKQSGLDVVRSAWHGRS